MEQMVVALCREQIRSGHQVLLITIYGWDHLAKVAVSEGIDVRSAMKRPRHQAFSTWRKLMKWFAEFSPNVVHSHNIVPHYYAAAVCLFSPRIRLINTRHDMGEHYSMPLAEKLFKLAVLRSSNVVAVCEAAKRNFVRTKVVSASKCVVIANGIALDRVLYPHKVPNPEITLNSDGVLAVVTAGRLHPVKDQATLIRAMKVVRDSGIAATLTIFGEGAERHRLERLVEELALKDLVIFAGAVDDLVQRLHKYHLFVLSSVTEGYSLALVEASAAGLPIVATDVGGNSEIVKVGYNGHLVEAGNAQQIAAAIVALAKDFSRRIAYGQRSRQWALEYGSINAMVHAYDSIYSFTKP